MVTNSIFRNIFDFSPSVILFFIIRCLQQWPIITQIITLLFHSLYHRLSVHLTLYFNTLKYGAKLTPKRLYLTLEFFAVLAELQFVQNIIESSEFTL